LVKTKRAVELSGDNPNIIDTEAEVLWKMKRFEEAIEAIERAITIDPDNQYYQDQKEKFLDSKKAESQSA
jgi:tetratricopeptide (TPR) repeat protein